MIPFISILLLLVVLVPPAETQLHVHQLSDCLNFGTAKNTCSVKNQSLEFQKTPLSVRCMTCTIEDVDVMRTNNCRKTFACAALVFHEQTIFEKFFARHRYAISNSFPSHSGDLTRPRLYISIGNYNSSKLTLQDIAKTININSSHMAISVNFTNLIWSSPIPTSLSDGFPIQVFRFVVYVCDEKYRRSWYSFRPIFSDIRNRIMGLCEKPHLFKGQPSKQSWQARKSDISSTMRSRATFSA